MEDLHDKPGMFGQMPGSGTGIGPGVIQDRFSPTMGRHRSNQLFNGHGGHIMPPTQSQFGEMGGKFMKSQVRIHLRMFRQQVIKFWNTYD